MTNDKYRAFLVFDYISGQQNSIVVTPSLYYTSDDALKQLKPKQRQCYEDKEVNLTYLARGRGYKV